MLDKTTLDTLNYGQLPQDSLFQNIDLGKPAKISILWSGMCTGFYIEDSLHGYNILIQWLMRDFGRYDRRKESSDWLLDAVTCARRKAKIFENQTPRLIALA